MKSKHQKHTLSDQNFELNVKIKISVTSFDVTIYYTMSCNDFLVTCAHFTAFKLQP